MKVLHKFFILMYTLASLCAFLPVAQELGAVDNGLYVQNRDGNTIHIIDRSSNSYAGNYEVQAGRADIVLPTPGGAFVYLVSNEGKSIEAFSAETGEGEAIFNENWKNIQAIAFAPRGDRLFVLDSQSGAATQGEAWQLIVYTHSRLSLEESLRIDFPVASNFVFNSRGTRYFAIAAIASERTANGATNGANGATNGEVQYFLINGDGITGRIYERLELGFSASDPPRSLRVSHNDRYAWLASRGALTLVDLRRKRIVRSHSGNYDPQSLSIEARGNRVLVAGAAGNAGAVGRAAASGHAEFRADRIFVYNVQNARELAQTELSAEVSASYAGFIFDSEGVGLVLPHSASAGFTALSFGRRNRLEASAQNFRSLPRIEVAQAVASTLKTGGSFACF